MKDYYTLYKTTNLVNNKIYIGVHQTSDPFDSYLGSGKQLKIAIEKYGEKNFKKEILGYYDNKEEMYLAEAEIVTKKFVRRKDTYNITPGGKIPPNATGLIRTEEHKRKISSARNGYVQTSAAKNKMSRSKKGQVPHNKKEKEKVYVRSEETRKKMSKFAIKRAKSKEYIEKLKLASKSSRKKVICVETGQIYESLTDVKRQNPSFVCVSAISDCAKGKSKSAYGFTWKFV